MGLFTNNVHQIAFFAMLKTCIYFAPNYFKIPYQALNREDATSLEINICLLYVLNEQPHLEFEIDILNAWHLSKADL